MPVQTPSIYDAPPPSSAIVLEQIFVEGLASTAGDAHIDGMVDKITRTWWPSAEPAIDEEWDNFVGNEIQLASSGEPSDLVKPSGTLAAPLMIMWHYPTMTTSDRAFGMSLDSSNPCVRLQCKKFRDDMSNALTLDAIPRRYNTTLHRASKAKGEPYHDETEQWKELTRSYVKWYFDKSAAKVVLLLGKRNFQTFTDTFPRATPIRIPGSKMYGKPARVWLIMERQEIVRIVIPSYHPEVVFRSGAAFAESSRPVLDTMWNWAAAITRKCNVNASYFSWKASSMQVRPTQERPVWENKSPISTMASMRRYEKDSQERISNDIVQDHFRGYIASEGLELDWEDKESSPILQLLRHVGRKGAARSHEVQAAAGYPGLAKGRATSAALGWPHLAAARAKGHASQAALGYPHLATVGVRGRATQEAAGYPNLIKANAILAAAGHPGLIKGRAALAAAGHPQLPAARAKGLAAQAAAGYPNLVKGHVTQAAAGYPQLAAAAAKGRATQAAAGHPNLIKANAARAVAGNAIVAKMQATKKVTQDAKDATLSEKELARRIKNRQSVARATARAKEKKRAQITTQ